MACGKVVLSYHDSLLREEDLELLKPPNWLNDKIIGFYFEYLEKEVFHEESERICFITPDVTQFVKLYQGSELAMFLEPLHLSQKDIVILAVNSSSSKTTAGGTHWSTLVYTRDINTFEHYDSYGSFNREEALKCSISLTHFLEALRSRNRESHFPIIVLIELSCPDSESQTRFRTAGKLSPTRKQLSYDCGVFCALFAEGVARSKLFTPYKAVNDILSFEKVHKWRKQVLELIKELNK